MQTNMRAIFVKTKTIGSEALGHAAQTMHQEFVVEESDVGVPQPGHLGRGHESISLTSRDVGRVITKFTDESGWNSWVFSGKGTAPDSSVSCLGSLAG